MQGAGSIQVPFSPPPPPRPFSALHTAFTGERALAAKKYGKQSLLRIRHGSGTCVLSPRQVIVCRFKTKCGANREQRSNRYHANPMPYWQLRGTLSIPVGIHLTFLEFLFSCVRIIFISSVSCQKCGIARDPQSLRTCQRYTERFYLQRRLSTKLYYI